jgi:hypothetical protein
MNDTELDRFLNTWSVPRAPASLRAGVRVGFHSRPERRKFRGLRVMITAAGIACFLLAVTLALPQTLSIISPTVRAPYIVDSDVLRFRNDGTSSVEVHLASYNNNGSEIVVYEVSPSLLTDLQLGLQAVSSAWMRLTLPLALSHEMLEKANSVARGSIGLDHYRLCSQSFGCVGSGPALLHTGCVIEPVVGRETILDHPTVAVQSILDDRRRVTMWMAPDLGCFALRITTEELRPDGTFHLVRKKQATKVTLTPGKTAATSRKMPG